MKTDPDLRPEVDGEVWKVEYFDIHVIRGGPHPCRIVDVVQDKRIIVVACDELRGAVSGVMSNNDALQSIHSQVRQIAAKYGFDQHGTVPALLEFLDSRLGEGTRIADINHALDWKTRHDHLEAELSRLRGTLTAVLLENELLAARVRKESKP